MSNADREVFKNLTAFGSSLRERMGEVNWISSARAVKSMVADLLKDGMVSQGFITDGPQFDVRAFRRSDDPANPLSEIISIDIRALNPEASNYLRWLYEQHPRLFAGPPPPPSYIVYEFVISAAKV